jgi:hypothetical protein
MTSSSSRDRFSTEGHRRHRLGDRSRGGDRDYRDRDDLDSRDERWERDREFDNDDNVSDKVQDMVSGVLHSDRSPRRSISDQLGPLDDLRNSLGSSWLEIQRFFSGTSGYHRACKFIKFMKMLESQN